jgi:DNA-binding NarL/FixJ family response regulator
MHIYFGLKSSKSCVICGMVQNDLTTHRTVRLLSNITGALVALLAAGAFALSFTALKELASVNGVSLGLTWIWPLILDGAIIVFSMAVLRASLYGESARYPMTLVVCATIASVIFNLAHAPENTVARLMACVPPLALFAAFELVVRQIRSEVERGSVIASLSELAARHSHLSSRKDTLEEQVRQMTSVRDGLKLEFKTARSAPVHSLLDIANAARADKIQRRITLVTDLAAQGKSPAEIAVAAGVSTKTVKRDLGKADTTLTSASPA